MGQGIRGARLPETKVYEEEILALCEDRLAIYEAPKALEFCGVLRGSGIGHSWGACSQQGEGEDQGVGLSRPN